MRQPDGYAATEILKDYETMKEMDDGRWVPCRGCGHNAWPWTWRFKLAWDVLTGQADVLYWEE